MKRWSHAKLFGVSWKEMALLFFIAIITLGTSWWAGRIQKVRDETFAARQDTLFSKVDSIVGGSWEPNKDGKILLKRESQPTKK